MKIVVLDGYGLNPGDLSWEEMQALGELTVYDRTAPAELLERSAGAEVLITNKNGDYGGGYGRSARLEIHRRAGYRI